MKVNGIPFLMTISRHIKFSSAGKLENMSELTIISHFKVIMGVYASRGFRVTVILANKQFKPMRGELANLGAIIKVFSHDEHVSEIERYNRTIKERVQAAYNILPFKFVPPVFIIEIMCFGEMCLPSKMASPSRKAHPSSYSTENLILMLITKWNLVSMFKLTRNMIIAWGHVPSGPSPLDPLGTPKAGTTSSASTLDSASTGATGPPFPCQILLLTRFTALPAMPRLTVPSPSPTSATKTLIFYTNTYPMTMRTGFLLITRSPQE
eukprot:CCRYP_019112-RA/>CCRYP_019112-RA protein AED:0.35 eAED:-0.77 QI:0/-1/0/1/-1/0/1/0/265